MTNEKVFLCGIGYFRQSKNPFEQIRHDGHPALVPAADAKSAFLEYVRTGKFLFTDFPAKAKTEGNASVFENGFCEVEIRELTPEILAEMVPNGRGGRAVGISFNSDASV